MNLEEGNALFNFYVANEGIHDEVNVSEYFKAELFNNRSGKEQTSSNLNQDVSDQDQNLDVNEEVLNNSSLKNKHQQTLIKMEPIRNRIRMQKANIFLQKLQAISQLVVMSFSCRSCW